MSSRFRPPAWGVMLAGVVFAAALLLPTVVAAQPQPPSSLNPASPNAQGIAQLYSIVFWLAVVVFVIVEGLLLYSSFRFRQRPDTPAGEPTQVEGNTAIEIAWTIAPALVLALIAILTLRTMRVQAQPPPTGINIQVIGHQWWWEVRYPDLNIVTANEVHVPVGQAAKFELTSADVIHSFWVPQLAGKTDVVPGQTNHTWFRADKPGVYHGQCAEFCGVQHAGMRFEVVAEPQAQFEQWVKAQQADAAPATGDAAQGQKIFTTGACIGCHTIRGTPAQSKVGPDLTHVGSRRIIAAGVLENTPQNLATWLHDPQAVKPGNKMPNLGLSQENVDTLVKYLESLK